MDTIEVANGDYRVAKLSLNFVYAIYHFHGKEGTSNSWQSQKNTLIFPLDKERL